MVLPWRRVGVLGGTFDPPHIGHLAAAVDARHTLELDVVLLVVANEPWQKLGSRLITSAATRLELVQAAVRDLPGIEASDVEIRRGGLSYTADTLEALAAEHPEAELVLLVGGDAAAGLDTWKRPERVKELASIGVLRRAGHEEAEPPPGWRWQPVAVPQLEVSSTELRARVGSGRPIDVLVPAAAADLIHYLGLYSSTP